MTMLVRIGLLSLVSFCLAASASAQTRINCRLDHAGIFGRFYVTFFSPQSGQVQWLAPVVPIDVVCNIPTDQRVCRGQSQNYVLELVGRRVTMRNSQTGGVIDTGSCSG